VTGGLEAGAIRAWCRLTGSCSVGAVQAALLTLSGPEQARAARFMFPEDRRDYVLAHALLRALLARCGGVPPAGWQLSADARGKPFVAAPACDLRFSLSHTRGCVAAVVSRGVDVGIDVESLARGARGSEIADRYFAPIENERLRASDDRRRAITFTELWTLKEATLKALGVGLALPLHDICFRLDGATIEFHGTRAHAHAWQFALFEPFVGYRLAIAARRATPDVSPALVIECLHEAPGPEPPSPRMPLSSSV
jgi:4'-phosphopantetheinyl transferase